MRAELTQAQQQLTAAQQSCSQLQGEAKAAAASAAAAEEAASTQQQGLQVPHCLCLAMRKSGLLVSGCREV